MVKLVLYIYHYFLQHKKLLFVLLAALVALFAYTASHVNFKEDISAFLPKDDHSGRINDAYQRLSPANNLLVSVSMSDSAATIDEDLMINAVVHFVEQLQQTDFFKRIDYQVDQQQILSISQFLVENMPYFLTESDYLRMDTLLTEDYIRLQLDNNKRMLMSPMSVVMTQNIMTDPLHLSAPVLAGLRDFQTSSQFQLYHDFIFSSDKKEAVISLASQSGASETRQNAEMLRFIDQAAANTQSVFEQKIKIRYFGSADIAVTNANRIKQDSLVSSLIAIALILSILLYTFRNFKNLLLMVGSLLFGWLFALGLLSVLRDEISLIAVGVSSIIIGIAVNYPLHFMLHHRHEPRIPNVIKEIVAPLTIGNITTVGAFLSLMFISSDAMHDLGLFASLLLAGTICFVLVFLPHFLKKTNLKASPPALSKGKGAGAINHPAKEQVSLSPVERGSGKKVSKWLFLSFIVLSIIFFILSFNTKFETDMNSINYMTDTQKADLQKYISTVEQGQHTIYYVSQGNHLEEALVAFEDSQAALDSLQTVGALSKISGLSIYLPSRMMQQKRLERWKTFCESKKDIFAKLDPTSVEKGFKSGAFSRFDNIVNTNFEVQGMDFFKPVTSSLSDNYMVNDKDGSMVMTVLHTTRNDLDELAAKLNTINANSFAFDAGTIGRSMIQALSVDFNTVLFVCGSIVFLFLVFTLGRIELSLLAFLPLTIGWFWILGIMNIFDIRFNIVNIILAAFIFGQGDDYTIFMTEGLMYEYSYKRKVLASYKKSISLSAIIMFIGIGSLIIAKHPALRSLAEVTIIGMGAVVLTTFMMPSFIFRWLTLRKGERRLTPVTLANIASSVYAFIAFLIGSLFLTITGFFLFASGKTTDRKKLRYHQLMQRIAHFVVMRIPRVKTTFNHYDKTIFDQPAVIICNHQSHIDLMCVMSLTPKLIILTNDWVWNSPFYGRLIKYADFYPVSSGIENALDKLQAIVEKGYSIVIFPEGTRSEDCSIRRFHRGAFYLAEQLKLDIIPVLIHGVGHLLPKKEFMLRKGEIHINVMQRMAYHALGESIAEQTKNARKFYIEEYAKLAAEVETADYYANLTLHNYIYKGPSVERTVRRNLKKYNNYRNIISQLKNHHHILIENCGYGEFPLLLSLVHQNLTIVATDNDADKLELAANCTWVKENLRYAENVPSEQFDAVIDCHELHE